MSLSLLLKWYIILTKIIGISTDSKIKKGVYDFLVFGSRKRKKGLEKEKRGKKEFNFCY
jgi:hypothetical protein